jgi:hypothetical protein
MPHSLKNENETRKSGNELHPSRVLFIVSNKILKDYNALRA